VGGVRVDLTAVEHWLARCSGVAAAAARAWPHRLRPQDSLVAAYVVPTQQQDQQGQLDLVSRLRAAAAAALPAAARPGSYTLLEHLPRSPAGKLLRAQLPQPAALAPAPAATQQQQQRPSGAPSEAQVMAAFMSGVDEAALLAPLEPTSDFFTAGGGDSLAAAAVAGRLGIDVRMVFAYPTARALAAALRQQGQFDAPTVLENRGQPISSQDGGGEGLFPAAKRQRLVVEVDEVTMGGSGQPAVTATAEGLAQLLSEAVASGTVSTAAGPAAWEEAPAQAPASHSGPQVVWRHPLGQCVDAAPELITLQRPAGAGGPATTLALACSHSGAVACCDAATGAAFWRAQLPGRCDAGLAAEPGLREVAVAYGGGCLCCLALATGAVLREVDCGGELRAAPAADPWPGSGRWWVGTHGRGLVVVEPGEGGAVLR
jgi:hypothetical protein